MNNDHLGDMHAGGRLETYWSGLNMLAIYTLVFIHVRSTIILLLSYIELPDLNVKTHICIILCTKAFFINP